MPNFLYSANGSLIKNIEGFADTSDNMEPRRRILQRYIPNSVNTPIQKKEYQIPPDFFNLAGNLRLAGVIRAMDFIKEDGTSLDTVTTSQGIPKNIYYVNDKMGINVSNPTANLDVKGVTRIDGELSLGDNMTMTTRNNDFRLNSKGNGDVFGINKDGHMYSKTKGPHMANFESDDNNPFISIGKSGEFNGKKWYIQNINANDETKSSLAIGKHGEGAKIVVDKDGNLIIRGSIIFENENGQRKTFKL